MALEPGVELEYRTAVRDAAFRHPTPYRLLLKYGFEDPTPDEGSLDSFLDGCVYDGPMDRVRRLGDFLRVANPGEGPSDLSLSEAPWTTDASFRLFVSHHSSDKREAAGLK